jgi:glycerol uptake facilitator-like aquaporin
MNQQARLDFFAELIGTFIFIGTIITVINSNESSMNFLKIGIALMASIVFLGSVSGGAFNPAVSLMFFLNDKIDLARMSSQILGQIVGCLLAIFAFNKLTSSEKLK